MSTPNAGITVFGSPDHKLRYLAALIKKEVTVADVASRFGFDYSVAGRLPCPACHEHSTTKQTVSLYDDAARWYCFRCNEGGDAINWLAARLDVSASAAIYKLCSLCHIEPDATSLVAYLRGTLQLKLAPNLPAHGLKLAALRELRRLRSKALADLVGSDTAPAAVREAVTNAHATPSAIAQLVAFFQHAAVAVHRGKGERMLKLAATVATMRAYRGGVGQVHLEDDQLFGFLEDHADQCVDDLPQIAKKQDALDYLRSRGFTLADLRPFGVGYAARRHLQSRESEEIAALKDTGLAFDDPPNPPRLMMSGRLVVPFRDCASRVVAMAGRSFADHGPKWINSADSPVFSKRCFLFGLDVALPFVLETRRLVIGEGYGEALAFHKAGIPGVATAGTALTPEHVDSIRGLVEEAVLFFDPDDAGVQATAAAADQLRGHVPTIKAVVRAVGSPDPDETDPDETDPETLRYLIATAEPLAVADTPAAWAARMRARLA